MIVSRSSCIHCASDCFKTWHCPVVSAKANVANIGGD